MQQYSIFFKKKVVVGKVVLSSNSFWDVGKKKSVKDCDIWPEVFNGI